MNNQVLQYIYLNYQPDQYYSKYLKENNQRQDARKSSEHRNIRISSGPSNSVIVSRGNTIVIAELSTNIQQVVYSPITDSYGKQLININANTALATAKNAKLQRNSLRATQNFINRFINWRQIQKQLVFQDIDKGILYAHTGQIVLRLADSDGCLQQTALIAVQILLLSVKFSNEQKYQQKTQMQKSSHKSLKISQFWFPIKYCEILNEIIIDPSQKQQKNCNYQVSLISNIKSSQKDNKIYRVIQVHKCMSSLEQTINALEGMYITQMSKLPLNIQQYQSKCQTGSGQTVLTISNL